MFKVRCWAIIYFLSRIRFPPGKSIATIKIKIKIKHSRDLHSIEVVLDSSGRLGASFAM